MAGTIVVDRIESDASYASTINVAGQITFSNTVNFGITSVIPVAGFYSPSTNNLAFTTASTERMRIDSSGNVGIGTSSPLSTSKLTVASGSLSVTGSDGNFVGGGQRAFLDYSANNVRFGATSGGVATATGLIFYYGSGSTAAEGARIDTSANLLFNSGYGSVATAYGCRAWVNFNGTGTPAIRASGNVSSITDHGTADYSINFTTAMPDANYSGHVTSDGAGGIGNFEQRGGGAGDITTTAWRVNGSGDRAYMHIIIIR